MLAKEVVSGLYLMKLGGGVNAYLIDSGDGGLTLIDTGYPKHAEAIEAGIRSIGRDPTDLTDILVTHAHPDHLGSAKYLSRGSVPVSLPADEAWIARAGVYEVTMSPAPGLLNRIMFRLVIGSKPREFPPFEPAKGLSGGEKLAVAGGIDVIHTPGHSTGHVSLLWRRDRNVLIVGDAVVNVPRLGFTAGYDDFETGQKSAAKLAGLDFEVAVFGHGRPIISNAAAKFAERFH